MIDCDKTKHEICERRPVMVDFSKKGNKKKRVVAMAICILLVAGMVIGMLVAAL